VDKQNLENLKNKLEEEKIDLENEIEKLKVAPDFGDDVDSGEEESDESAATDNQMSMMETFKERLANVETALEKMQNDKYGICEKCGEEISMQVLEVDPESRLCKTDKQKEN